MTPIAAEGMKSVTARGSYSYLVTLPVEANLAKSIQPPLAYLLVVIGDEFLQVTQVSRRNVAAVVGQQAATRAREPYLGGVLLWSLHRNVHVNRLTVLSGPEKERLR